MFARGPCYILPAGLLLGRILCVWFVVPPMIVRRIVAVVLNIGAFGARETQFGNGLGQHTPSLPLMAALNKCLSLIRSKGNSAAVTCPTPTKFLPGEHRFNAGRGI